jgi:hypothetical protein
MKARIDYHLRHVYRCVDLIYGNKPLMLVSMAAVLAWALIIQGDGSAWLW